MPADETAIIEKTFNICKQTQELMEALKKDLASRQAKLASSKAYNEAAAGYLAKAQWEAEKYESAASKRARSPSFRCAKSSRANAAF